MNLVRNLQLLYKPSELDDLGRKRFGTWSQAYSGHKYWILDPFPEEIYLVDIVVGLSNAARYRGQTKFFYPVLTHCALVSDAVFKTAKERGWPDQNAYLAAFEGLMHDATEAYLGDVARPLKRQPAMREYCRIESLWEKAVHERFNIKSTKETAALVKECDQRIVLDEIQVLMRRPEMWAQSGRYVDLKPTGMLIPKLSQEECQDFFMDRYVNLREKVIHAP